MADPDVDSSSGWHDGTAAIATTSGDHGAHAAEHATSSALRQSTVSHATPTSAPTSALTTPRTSITVSSATALAIPSTSLVRDLHRRSVERVWDGTQPPATPPAYVAASTATTLSATAVSGMRSRSASLGSIPALVAASGASAHADPSPPVTPQPALNQQPTADTQPAAPQAADVENVHTHASVHRHHPYQPHQPMVAMHGQMKPPRVRGLLPHIPRLTVEPVVTPAFGFPASALLSGVPHTPLTAPHNAPHNASHNPSGPASTTPMKVVATASYHALLPDETSVRVGDTLVISRLFKDGWAYGRNVSTSTTGILPVSVYEPVATTAGRSNLAAATTPASVSASITSIAGCTSSTSSTSSTGQSHASTPRSGASYLAPPRLFVARSSIAVTPSAMLGVPALSSAPPDTDTVPSGDVGVGHNPAARIGVERKVDRHARPALTIKGYRPLRLSAVQKAAVFAASLVSVVVVVGIGLSIGG